MCMCNVLRGFDKKGNLRNKEERTKTLETMNVTELEKMENVLIDVSMLHWSRQLFSASFVRIYEMSTGWVKIIREALKYCMFYI